MNNEIKEILDKLQRVANRETASRNALMEMKDTDYQLLLDYITNLQQEIKELKEDKSKMFETAVKRNNQLLDRIDKAIGIANERINYCYQENDKEQLESWQEIFDILLGKLLK